MTAEVNEAMPAAPAAAERLALRVRYALSIGLDRLAATIDGLMVFLMPPRRSNEYAPTTANIERSSGRRAVWRSDVDSECYSGPNAAHCIGASKRGQFSLWSTCGTHFLRYWRPEVSTSLTGGLSMPIDLQGTNWSGAVTRYDAPGEQLFKIVMARLS